MTRFASALPLLALFAATLPSTAHAQAARDFQLPPAATPTPDTRVQGPVDTDAPVPVRPRTIETARPAEPTPTPTASAAPAIVLPSTAPTRSATQRATAERTPPLPTASTAAAESAPLIATPTAASTGAPVPFPTVSNPTSTTATPAAAAPALEAPFPWLWLALGGAALAAGAAGLILWRRRGAEVMAPEIIVPAVPAATTHPSEALAIAVEAVRMDRSVLNATVGYRITVRNRTAQALNGVAVEADLVSAGGDRPAEQQLASPEQALTPRHAAERLAPGQSLRFEGQARLPLSEANAIWQGRIGLLVPLLRVRATAANAAPVATTLVIGRAEGSTARPQPFRLDEPPRSYAPLAQRVLDAMPARA